MLDLKAKLLQAGLVTEDQVEKVEAEEQKKRDRRNKRKKDKRGSGGPVDERERWAQRVKKLTEAPKSEQYDTIRQWVERTRLDDPKARIPDSDDAWEKFHFQKHDGGIGWLTLPPDLVEKLKSGEAGIIAFMSHHGLSHCVVPDDMTRDVHQIRPEWVRVHKELEVVQPPAPADDVDDDASGSES